MVLNSKNSLLINTLSPKPDITIWYSKIQDIADSVFNNKPVTIFKPVINQTFAKKDFIEPIFNTEEIETINSFKALKKQIEWISGRVLIKKMLQYFFFNNVSLNEIMLSYHDQGAPFLTREPDIPISLSHSNEYASAALSINTAQTLGIDIEKIGKKPDLYFMKTAFTKNEILNLKDNAASIFKNWTIKEAYLKYIKKGFNENLHRVEIINDEILHNNKKINVDVYSTFINPSYVLSLVSDLI